MKNNQVSLEIRLINEQGLEYLSVRNIPEIPFSDLEMMDNLHYALTSDLVNSEDFSKSFNQDIVVDEVTFNSGLNYLPVGANSFTANKITLNESLIIVRPASGRFVLTTKELIINTAGGISSWGEQGSTGIKGENGRSNRSRGNGTEGSKGLNGGNGTPSCDLELDLGNISFVNTDPNSFYDLSIRTIPGPGGTGGEGGDGGDGRDANCIDESGNGGDAGDGGDGGKGADGKLLICNGRILHQHDINKILLHAPGGRRGSPGQPGKPGKGGDGYFCGPMYKPVGRHGGRGQYGASGAIGKPGTILSGLKP